MKTDFVAISGVSESPVMYISRTGTKNSGDTTGFQEIRSSQDAFATDNTDVVMAFTDSVNFPGASKMSDDLHYTQTGYNEMGSAMQGTVE
jgi:hypothetical protein